MKDPKKDLKKRVAFMAKREAALNGKVSSVERKLFQIISEFVFSRLETENGLIKSTKGNLKVSQAIDGIFKRFNKKYGSELVNQFKDDLLGTMNLHDNYFREFGSATKTAKTKTKVRGIMNARLGISEKGTLISGGFLHNLLNDSSLKNEIVNATVAATSGRSSFNAFKNQVSVLVKGSKQIAGGRLQRHYRQFAYDTYGEADRTYSKLWAEELKMTSFLYLGGLIKTSRRFCCQRNGLVFTVDEAKKWKDINFSGKPTSGYKPITQLGGHGCRHSAQWIDNDQALIFRKDLEIVDGRLKRKKGSQPQRLNTGCSGRT